MCVLDRMFKPSDVPSVLPDSQLGIGGKILAVQVSSFLSSHGDSWGRVILVSELFAYMKKNVHVGELYQNPLETGNPLASYVLSAMDEFFQSEKLEVISRTEEQVTSFQVGPELVILIAASMYYGRQYPKVLHLQEQE